MRGGGEVERVAGMTGLADRLAQPISQLSRGYRQRVGIADALLGSPGLLVLDEPTVGLDPNQVQEIRAMLKTIGEQQTLVFSSHILAEVEALCDRVAILSEGKLVVDAPLAEALAAGSAFATFGSDPLGVDKLLARLRGALEVAALDTSVESAGEGDATGVRFEIPDRLQSTPDVFLQAVGDAAAREGVAVHRLELSRTRLEERFAEVTGAQRTRTDSPA